MDNVLAFFFLRYGLIAFEFAAFILSFLIFQKKKKHWLLVIIATLVVSFSYALLISIPVNELCKVNHYESNLVASIGSLVNISIFVIMSFGFYFAFDINLKKLLSILSIAYASREIVFCIYSIPLNFINPNLLFIRINQQNFINGLIYALVYLITISLSFIINYINKKKVDFNLDIPSLIILLVIIILNNIYVNFAQSYSSDHLLIFNYVLMANLVTMVLVIVLNFYNQVKYKIKLENEMSNRLLKQQEQQYKFAKVNAELMYIKSHDLKHQVSILRKGGEDAKKILDELEETIARSDSIIMTDNNVMNIIISEKWQYCLRHNIKLTCNVNPHAFNNVSNVHLYTMIANVLENAIEAVMKIKDKPKRIISLSISEQHGVSILICRNYFDGELKIKDGHLLTKKEDKKVHGFGFLSIENVAKKYEGNIQFDVDKDVFTLQIAIPN